MATGNTPFVAPDKEPIASKAEAKRTRKIAEAKAFLQQRLADGPRPATEVLLAAAARGIAEGTLYTAKRRMRVQSRRQGYEGGQWVWVLPVKRVGKDQMWQPTAPVGMN